MVPAALPPPMFRPLAPALSAGADPLSAPAFAVRARWRGSVVVSYRGSPDAGCERLAACQVSGRLVYAPAGALIVVTRKRGLVSVIGSHDGLSGAVRSPAGVCHADADPFPPLGSLTHGTLTVSLRSESFDTDCAGPLNSDISRLLPQATLPETAVRNGGHTMRFTTDRPFTVPGFTGHVRSTVTLLLGRPPRTAAPTPRQPPTRSLTESLTVQTLAGSERVVLPHDGRGCTRTATCGLGGSLTWTPGTVSGQGRVTAQGPVRTTSAAALRAAIDGGPASPSIDAGGELFSADGGGTLTADTRLAGARCRDDVALGGVELDIDLDGPHDDVAVLLPQGDPRTRCAGTLLPLGMQAPISRAQLRRREFTLRFRTPSTQPRHQVTGGLTLTVRLGPPTAHVGAPASLF